MKALARLVVCSTLLIVCSAAAHADSVTLSGNVSFDQVYATFSTPFSTGVDSGYFSAFSGGSVQYFLGTIPYMVGVLGGTEETFTITNSNGDVLAYYNQLNSPSQSYDSNGNLVASLNETGFYTINGGQQQAGFFNLTLQGTSPTGAASNVMFSAIGGLTTPTVSPVNIAPEPDSIFFLGSGLLGLAAMVHTRRRRSV